MVHHPVHRQRDHRLQRKLRFPRRARGAVIVKADLTEPHGADHPAHIGRAVVAFADLVQDHPVGQPELAHIAGQIIGADAVDEPVKPAPERRHHRPIGQLLADAVDDLIALPPQRQHLGDQLGRVLQIGVQLDRAIPPRRLVGIHDRVLIADIAREPKHPEARVLGRDLGQNGEGAVGRVVVGEDDLGLVTGQTVQHGGDAVIAGADVFFFVIGGDQDGNQAHALRLSRRLADWARARSQAIA